MNGLKVD